MPNLSNAQRAELESNFCLDLPNVKLDQLSTDGTRKWLLNFGGGADIETVFIPDLPSSSSSNPSTYTFDRGSSLSSTWTTAHQPQQKRTIWKGTLCISSQVGCSLNCSFCRTGTQKLLRNLTAEEIFTQVMHAMHTLEAFPRSPTLPNPVNNIVLMGQGEPLYNYRAVAQAVKNMIHHLKISPHRITLSTSGVASLIPKIASDLGISLAVSLHATNNRLRDLLVPLNKTYDISTVIKAVDEYTALSSNTIASPRHRRVTFEYVMLNDVNDSLLEAKALIKLIRHLPSPHVNLMAFNPWQGSGFSASPSDRIEAFAAVLKDAGADTTVRKSRGKDIDAACGQLKSREEVKKRGSL